jgi:cytochrome c
LELLLGCWQQRQEHGQELDRKYETRAFQITDEVKRADASLGKRLYTVRSGCIDCHGPDGAGMKVM